MTRKSNPPGYPPTDGADEPRAEPPDRSSSRPSSSRSESRPKPGPTASPIPPIPPIHPDAPASVRRAAVRASAGRAELGRDGETWAARYLERQGYRIVARNVRADRVEIDLIARRGPLLVFVEVKTRRSQRMGRATESVDARKQQRLRRGGLAWLASRPEQAVGAGRLRFDVITCVLGGPSPRDWARAPGEPRAPGAGEPSERCDPIGADQEGPTRGDITASDGTRWQIEHWEDAF